jgi:hypothetical protein
MNLLRKHRLLWIVVGTVWSIAFVESQTIPRVTIRGHVTDDSTDAPLPSVNVFIAGTMINTVTDTNGVFVLNTVPLGSHDLVISRVGYETVTYPLTLARQTDRVLNFRLHQRTINLPTTEITDQFDKSWKDHLEVFTKEFVGSSANAKECRILNPEILDFTHDSLTGNLKTFSDRPLYLENRALGYHIMMLLHDFEKSPGLLRYTVQLQFDELQSPDSSTTALWKLRRMKTYRGSMRDFLCSLIGGDAHRNGFIVQKSDDPAYGEVSKYELDHSDVISVTYDSLSNYERYINFPGYVRVMYLNDREPDEYTAFRTYDGSENTTSAQHQTSWMLMQATRATVDLNGNLLLPYCIKVFGYWAFQRIADTLPRDYEPDEDK